MDTSVVVYCQGQKLDGSTTVDYWIEQTEKGFVLKMKLSLGETHMNILMEEPNQLMVIASDRCVIARRVILPPGIPLLEPFGVNVNIIDQPINLLFLFDEQGMIMFNETVSTTVFEKPGVPEPLVLSVLWNENVYISDGILTPALDEWTTIPASHAFIGGQRIGPVKLLGTNGSLMSLQLCYEDATELQVIKLEHVIGIEVYGGPQLSNAMCINVVESCFSTGHAICRRLNRIVGSFSENIRSLVLVGVESEFFSKFLCPFLELFYPIGFHLLREAAAGLHAYGLFMSTDLGVQSMTGVESGGEASTSEVVSFPSNALPHLHLIGETDSNQTVRLRLQTVINEEKMTHTIQYMHEGVWTDCTFGIATSMRRSRPILRVVDQRIEYSLQEEVKGLLTRRELEIAEQEREQEVEMREKEMVELGSQEPVIDKTTDNNAETPEAEEHTVSEESEVLEEPKAKRKTPETATEGLRLKQLELIRRTMEPSASSPRRDTITPSRLRTTGDGGRREAEAVPNNAVLQATAPPSHSPSKRPLKSEDTLLPTASEASSSSSKTGPSIKQHTSDSSIPTKQRPRVTAPTVKSVVVQVVSTSSRNRPAPEQVERRPRVTAPSIPSVVVRPAETNRPTTSGRTICIDSHVHLDRLCNIVDFAKVEDLRDWIRWSRNIDWIQRVEVLCFANFIDIDFFYDRRMWSWIQAIAKDPQVFGCSIGCHPKQSSDLEKPHQNRYLHPNHPTPLSLLRHILTMDKEKNPILPKLYGVGESGFDLLIRGNERNSTPSQQRKALGIHAELALEFGKLLTLHIRCKHWRDLPGLEKDTIDVLRNVEKKERSQLYILCHWYSGSERDCELWLEAFPGRCFFGLNTSRASAMGNTLRDAARIFERFPNQVVLESDGPYGYTDLIPPAGPCFRKCGHKGAGGPYHVAEFSRLLANEIRGHTTEDVMKQCYKNMRRACRLD